MNLWVDVLLIYLGLLLVVLWSRVKDEQQRADFWKKEMYTWHTMCTSMEKLLNGQPGPMPQFPTEVRVGESWDGVPKLKLVPNETEEDDVT